MQLLDQEAGVCAMEAHKDPHAVFPAQWDDRFSKNLNFIIQLCDEIQSEAGRNMGERILQMANQRIPLQVINNNLHSMKGVIEDDVRVRTFCYVRSAARTLLIQVPASWHSVWDKFESTKIDIERGTECYAHELYDGCVFHMMMILERGLASLASTLGVRRGQKAWGALIPEIEKAIEAFAVRQRLTPKGAKPPTPAIARKNAALLTFYSEAAKEFVYFKDAWRNHVSHGRARYKETDAIKVMNHVRDFMIQLSRRLKEVK